MSAIRRSRPRRPALRRWEYALHLLCDESPFVLEQSPHQEGHVSNEPVLPWFTHDSRQPWRGYWTARASIPGAAGHLTLAEVVNTAYSDPEPYEYQYHVHPPPSTRLPLGRNVRFCKDRKALKFGQLYHAHDYPELGPRPAVRRAHLPFPGVCLRWAVAVAAVLLEEQTLSLAALLRLNELADFCPDTFA